MRKNATILSALAALIPRYLVLIGLAFWMGGFMFYAGVVIHVGHRVFGSARETGFLTDQVTLWLNRSGVIVLTILALSLVRTPRTISRAWWIAVATLAIMAGMQIFLFQLHPRLDAFLDFATQAIRDRAAFRREHLLYLNLSVVQWIAALLHLACLLVLWRTADAKAAESTARAETRAQGSA